MPGASMYANLDGLQKALEVQGGMGTGLDMVRTDAGLYLYHDVVDYLSRAQTYWLVNQVAYDGTGGVDGTAVAPSVAGLRFGRYLIAVDLISTSVANLVGAGVSLFNAGLQPGFPAVATPAVIATYGITPIRQVYTGFAVLVPDASLFTFPLWCPPGTYIQLDVNVSGVSGTYYMRAMWATTEELNQAGTAPIGAGRAPVKV